MKKEIMLTALTHTEAEKRFATFTLKGRKIKANAQKAEVARLTRRHEELFGRPAFDAETAKIEIIAKANLKTKRARIDKLVNGFKPVYVGNDAKAAFTPSEIKPAYTAYVNALTSGRAEAFAEAKTALKALLATSYELNYSVKTCEVLLAAVGLTYASVAERARGLMLKPRSVEDFARMLVCALYTQGTKEGRKVSADKAAAIITALNEAEAEAEAEAAAIIAE